MAKEWKQTFLTGFKLGPGVLDLAPSFLCFCFLFLSLRSFLSFLFLSIAFPVFFVCCSHPSIVLLSLIPLSLFLSSLKCSYSSVIPLFLFLSLFFSQYYTLIIFSFFFGLSLSFPKIPSENPAAIWKASVRRANMKGPRWCPHKLTVFLSPSLRIYLLGS